MYHIYIQNEVLYILTHQSGGYPSRVNFVSLRPTAIMNVYHKEAMQIIQYSGRKKNLEFAGIKVSVFNFFSSGSLLYNFLYYPFVILRNLIPCIGK